MVGICCYSTVRPGVCHTILRASPQLNCGVSVAVDTVLLLASSVIDFILCRSDSFISLLTPSFNLWFCLYLLLPGGTTPVFPIHPELHWYRLFACQTTPVYVSSLWGSLYPVSSHGFSVCGHMPRYTSSSPSLQVSSREVFWTVFILYNCIRHPVIILTTLLLLYSVVTACSTAWYLTLVIFILVCVLARERMCCRICVCGNNHSIKHIRDTDWKAVKVLD